jgi:predicted nucleic acid-binding protein
MGLPNRFVVTDNACAELEAGARNGHHDARQLHELINAGLVQRVQLGTEGAVIYESLIVGSALCTLDDGEAATIAYASEAASIALIDERKARSLCAASFPNLLVTSTVELLMHDAIATALDAQGQIEALVNALTRARMRVPVEHLTKITALLGTERIATCMSLPKRVRVPC